jgi:hypothetical protein
MKNELSKEVLAREIHQKAVGLYNVSEEYAYKFIMEVKRIRDERHYKELGYSNFDDYCMDAWGIKRNIIDEKVVVADRLGEESSGYSQRYGHKKSLLLARMSEESREVAVEKGIPTEDGNKSIEETTQKELREYQQRLKQIESEKDKLSQDNKQLSKQLKESQSNHPEIIEVEKIVHIEKEVDKTDYDSIRRMESQIEKTLKENQRLADTIERIKTQNNLLEERLQQEEADANAKRALEKELELLKSQKGDVVRQFKAAKELGDFQAKVQVFLLEELSPMAYSKAKLEIRDSPALRDSFTETLALIEDWLRSMKKEVNGIYIDGEIIDMEMNN